MTPQVEHVPVIRRCIRHRLISYSPLHPLNPSIIAHRTAFSCQRYLQMMSKRRHYYTPMMATAPMLPYSSAFSFRLVQHLNDME